MAKVKISGLERLNRRFFKLPDAARKEISIAMEKGAQEVVDFAKALAPVGQVSGVNSSNNPGALRDSIGWTWGRAPKGSISLGRVVDKTGDLVITIFAGNDKAFYARWVEFGTKAHGIDAVNAPTMGRAGRNFGVHVNHPGAKQTAFFFPAYRALRKKVRARISRGIKKSIRNTINSN
jgi:HK97 gp10 family phage protein